MQIADRIEHIIAEAGNKDVRALFNLAIGQQVYCIAGLFCNAWEKESARRTGNNNVGGCIQSINGNVSIDEDEEMGESIKVEIPI